ncbi:MAG: N-acetylmuramoyl-L-alanine amidase [Acidimicrobiia bacterium]
MSSIFKGRQWLAGGLAMLTLVSCSLATTTPPISRDFGVVNPTPSSTIPETTTTTEAPAPSEPVSPLPESAGVLITPSGVVVALLDQNGDRFVIRTPCGVETTIEGGTPVGDVEVVIDPGHGGDPDPGAVGANGLTEEEINLRVSRVVQQVLSERGVKSVLTRTANYSSTLGVRAALADQAAARVLVSIHHNAPTANLGDEPGTEVFVQSTSANSRRLGGLIYEHVFDAFDQFDILWSRAPDAGVLEVLNTRGTDAYGMVRSPETVAVLAELGYISNRPEAELYATSEYVTVAAQAVADAIVAYLETDAPGSGFIAAPRVFTPNRGISGNVCEDPALS